MRQLLLLLCTCSLCACAMSRALTPAPGAKLRTQSADGKVSARVKQVQLKWSEDDDSGPDQLVIEIKNDSKQELKLIPKKVRLLRLRGHQVEKVKPVKTGPAVPGINPVAGVVGGASAGVDLGGNLSGGGGGGAMLGGLGGAMVGIAAVAAVMIPVSVYVLADHIARNRERDIDPGEACSLRVSLGNVKLDDWYRYALDLNDALTTEQGRPPPMEPLMVALGDKHRGYGPPSSLRWIWAVRLGGGAIWEGPTTGGIGGAELFFGRQWGHFSLGAFAMLGPGSTGLEARYRLDLHRYVSLVPFCGYGYTFAAGRYGWAVGHGPRGGLELDFPIARKTRMGYSARMMTIGIYGHAGPLFIHEREGVGLKMQFGMVFGFF